MKGGEEGRKTAQKEVNEQRAEKSHEGQKVLKVCRVLKKKKKERGQEVQFRGDGDKEV